MKLKYFDGRYVDAVIEDRGLRSKEKNSVYYPLGRRLPIQNSSPSNFAISI